MSETDERNDRIRHFREDSEAQAVEETDGGTFSAEESSAKSDAEQAPSQQDDYFDYVIPSESYKKHSRRSHKHSSSRRLKVRTVTVDGDEPIEEGYVFAPSKDGKHRHRHHHHRRRSKFKRLARWKRVLIIILAVLLSLAIALGGTYLILNEIGKHGMHYNDGLSVSTPAEDESGNDIVKMDNSGRVITYNGISYELNQNLISIAFIGVDEGKGHDNTTLQMSDAIYILTLDTKTGKIKILSISRDTMADVDEYTEQGDFVDTQRMQIAFSYAFGNKKVTGGKNTTTSVSRLFYGLPFDNYFAINMDALIDLNDAIGGVTLTSSMTFQSPEDGRTISEGETVTLHGKEADTYVRTRDTSKLDSNNERMKRQQEYIKAFLSSVVPAVKSDVSVVTKLYDVIRDNSDTNLNLPKMTYIASTAASKLNAASDIEYVSLTGEITKGEFAEMHVTNETAIKTMLNVFYLPPDLDEDIKKGSDTKAE
jgi:LCP family protein required for cell wall assembly